MVAWHAEEQTQPRRDDAPLVLIAHGTEDRDPARQRRRARRTLAGRGWSCSTARARLHGAGAAAAGRPDRRVRALLSGEGCPNDAIDSAAASAKPSTVTRPA